MNIITKILAAATAAVAVSAFGMTSVIVCADETTTITDVVTTTATSDTSESETTTTETTNTPDTSDTTTTTTTPVSYSAWLSLNNGGNTQQDNAVTFSTNGIYTVKYKFDTAYTISAITSLVLESDINSETAADVKFKVTEVKLGTDENAAKKLTYTNDADDVFGVDEISKLYRLNIINTDAAVADLGFESDFAPNADDILLVTFTVEGLAEPDTTTTTTTTTTTRTISYVGYSNNGNNNTNTVSKTADEGVVAIVVTAVAAVALAAGAMTVRKKRK